MSDECYRCGGDPTAIGSVANGKYVCSRCINPLRRCSKCDAGEYVSKPTPNWMNRWVCNNCNHKVSR